MMFKAFAHAQTATCFYDVAQYKEVLTGFLNNNLRRGPE